MYTCLCHEGNLLDTLCPLCVYVGSLMWDYWTILHGAKRKHVNKTNMLWATVVSQI